MPRPRRFPLTSSAKLSPDEEEEEKVAPSAGSPSPPLKRQKTTYASPDASPAAKVMEGSPARVSTRSSSSSSQASVKSGRRSLQKQGRQEDDEGATDPTISDAPHSAGAPSEGEDTEDPGKRARSLEALFKVTDSELASMSKQGSKKPLTVATEKNMQVLSGSDKMLKVGSKPTTPSVRIVRVSQMASGGTGTPTSMSVLPVIQSAISTSAAQSPVILTPLASSNPIGTPSGSVSAGVKLDSHVTIPLSSFVTMPSHTVITIPPKTPKNQPTASQNLVRARSEEALRRQLALHDRPTARSPMSQSFDTQGDPRPNQPRKAVSVDTVVMSVADVSSPPSGRRPKAHARPGKYPCPYCHRTCAKPSVLEKHIRAHTNERPYPCEICNIAFKTKSNLFKHKKSRAHLLKANPGAAEQLRMSSGSKDSVEEEFEGEEMDTDDNETDVSMDTIGSTQHQDSLTSQESITEYVETPGRSSSAGSEMEFSLTVVQTPSGELKLHLPPGHSMDSAEKMLQIPDADLKAKRERLKKGKGSSLPNLHVQSHTLSPMQRQLSIGNLASPKLTVSDLAKLPEELKTERINAHINQLISTNNDLLSAPKAAPPRPKRVAKILHSKSDSTSSESTLAAQSLASTSFDSFDSPATPMIKMGTPHLLHSASSSFDSPDYSQLMARSTETQGTPTIQSMISKSAPQEIKIQIKLAPPGGNEGGLNSSSGGGLVSNPLGFISTPGTPGIRPVLKTPISISPLGTVLSNSVGTPINIRTLSTIPPLIGQPVVQFPRAGLVTPSISNTGSTPVKDLLAQKKSTGTPMVIIESPEGEKTTPEGKSLDSSGASIGRQVIYLNQQGSLDIPQHVAEQVEVVSSIRSGGKQGMVRSLSVPSSATLAGTPGMTPGSIIFEQYDPHTPPKRGRPKGSRNLVRDQHPIALAPNTPSIPATPNFQAGRFPLLPQAPIVAPTTNNPRPTLKLMIPSQAGSVIQSPLILGTQTLTLSSTSAMTLTPSLTLAPGSTLTPQTAPTLSTSTSAPMKGQDGTSGTPGSPNTPTAHLKKILKGQILMKRSISMSSGLNTTKESFVTKPSLLSSPQKYLRSESVDDAALRQQSGGDSPGTSLSLRRPPLVRQSKSDAGVLPSSRTEESRTETSVDEDVAMEMNEEEKKTQGPEIPVNEHQRVYLPMNPHTCPLLVNTKPFPKQLAIIPSLLSGKAKLVNWDSKERDGSVDTTDSQHDSATGSQADTSTDTPMDTSTTSTEAEDGQKTPLDTPEAMEVEIKATKQSSTESGIDVSSTDLASPELPEDKAALEHRARMQILLLSHQYPILRNDTHTTFCTVVKPQPAYVAMEGVQISMYSNWRAATYNPNPQGLTSRQLMDLYQSRWFEVAPSLCASSKITEDKESTLTHSSFWNHYGDTEKTDEMLAEKDAKLAAETVMKVLRLEKDPLDVKIEVKETLQEDSPPVPQQTIVVVASETPATPATPATATVLPTPPASDAADATPQPLGLGYKTNEDYVYIRGKGRGKYVCKLCGVRCKKPSMLKKHIRSHSDFRPYICNYCNLYFKTKGNLTKHMKSKSHHKRCVHLGILPVPTTVDENQIDSDVLNKQSVFAWSTKILDISPGSNDGSFAEDENEDDDENEEELEEEEVQTTMVIEDGTVIEVESSKDIESEEHEVPGEIVQVQDEVTGEVQFLYVDHQTEVTVEGDLEEGEVPRIIMTHDGKQGDGGRPSMDKELAAHTLLDLSKQTDPQPDDSSDEKDASSSDRDASPGDKRRKLPRQQCISDDDSSQDRTDQRLDSLIGQLKTRTVPLDKPTPITETGAALLTKVGHTAVASSARMAATIYRATSPTKQTAVTTAATTPKVTSPPALTRSDSIPGRKGGTTYAQKIAALQSKNELDLKLTISDGSAKGSGFVPPVFGIETRVEEKVTPKVTPPTTNRPRLVKSDSEPNPRPIQHTLSVHNPRVLMRQKSVDVDSRTSEQLPKPQMLTLLGHKEGGAASRRRSLSRQASVTDEDPPETSSDMVTIEIPGPEGGVAKIQVPLHVFKSTITTNTATVTTPKVQYITEGNHAPHEIHPIPGKVSDKQVGGPYACSECDKVLPNQQLLTMHQKAHLLECAHKCDDCSQSFRSKALLQKHQRTNEHKARVALNQQVASAQGDTSRLFRCTECDVAFYTHGNLAKHLRSHKHIMSLEKVGKLPIGAALRLEGIDLKTLDCTDSETALRGLLHFYDPDTYPPIGKADGAAKSASKDQSEEGEEYMFDNGGYERVASNEKVTVEMKTNTIDLSDISQRRGETHEEDGDEGQGQSVAGHGSRCGICRQNFSSPDDLQRHMPSHAELRPYVCQHCDAGFTRYSFLEAHMTKCFKQSQQAYMCGNCRETFTSVSSLQQHQCSAKLVTMATAQASPSQSSPASSSPQVVQMIPVSADGKVLYLPLIQSSSSKPVQLVRSRSMAAAPSSPEVSNRHPLLLRSASDAGVFAEGTLPTTPTQQTFSLHSPLIFSGSLQSPISSPLIRTGASPHSPLKYLPRIQSPLVRSSLPISPLAMSASAASVASAASAASQLTPTQVARNLFKDSASPQQSSVKVMNVHGLSPLVSADRSNQFSRSFSTPQSQSSTKAAMAPSTIYSPQRSAPSTSNAVTTTMQVVTSVGGYQTADEATKQHLAKLLNTDQDSLGQVQVMELEGESIHQMGLQSQETSGGDMDEVVYIIQMNEDQAQSLPFQSSREMGVEQTFPNVTKALVSQKTIPNIYIESETDPGDTGMGLSSGGVMEETQGFDPAENSDTELMINQEEESDEINIRSQQRGNSKRKEPEISEHDNQPPHKRRHLDI